MLLIWAAPTKLGAAPKNFRIVTRGGCQDRQEAREGATPGTGPGVMLESTGVGSSTLLENAPKPADGVEAKKSVVGTRLSVHAR